jgi:hypothetical protein
MRNTVVLLLIVLAYAFASERDYQDAELVATAMVASRAERACWAAPAQCDRVADGLLAENGFWGSMV